MSEDQFTKLFKYMQREFSSMRKDMMELEARLSSRIDSVYALLDSHIKQREIYEQERQALAAQSSRHRVDQATSRWYKAQTAALNN